MLDRARDEVGVVTALSTFLALATCKFSWAASGRDGGVVSPGSTAAGERWFVVDDGVVIEVVVEVKLEAGC